MKSVEYTLNIFMPGSIDTSAVEPFVSDTPFVINKGDIIHPGGFFPDNFISGTTMFQVVQIEHTIFHSKTSNNIKHIMKVYTREVKDTRELALEDKVENPDKTYYS